MPGVRCLRLTFVGELGFELHIPSDHAAAAYATLRQAADALPSHAVTYRYILLNTITYRYMPPTRRFGRQPTR